MYRPGSHPPASKQINPNKPKGWYDRSYLPHFDVFGLNQFVTFRLHDSVPEKVIKQWEEELKFMPEEKRRIQVIRMIEKYLDLGRGHSWLANPAIAQIVVDSLEFWDNQRYKLHAYVVMPNHVHVLFKPFEGQHLYALIQSIKKYTSRRADAQLGRRGPFWYREYFDRYMRDEQHFIKTVAYIHQNPVKAGLCSSPADWPFSSAQKMKGELQAEADLEISGPSLLPFIQANRNVQAGADLEIGGPGE